MLEDEEPNLYGGDRDVKLKDTHLQVNYLLFILINVIVFTTVSASFFKKIRFKTLLLLIHASI